MNTEKKVFNKLFSSEKVELASEKFEFGVVQDDIKVVDNAEKAFDDAFGLISSAKQKAIPIIKNSIAEANQFLKRLSEKTTVDNPLLKPVDRSKKKTNLTMVTKVRNIINFLFLGYLKC